MAKMRWDMTSIDSGVNGERQLTLPPQSPLGGPGPAVPSLAIPSRVTAGRATMPPRPDGGR